ncbi:hypothetical protein HI914_04632 [Erysiphe necator]|nr:hypothetical protein HI914_04632 [Erysiphe necator]
MHFHGFKCILTLLLLNLSSSSALNDLSYDERGLMISSAECSSRKYSADTIYNAVRTGVDAIAYANRIGFEPLVKTYTPKKGEVLGLNGPYYVHRFWNDGTDIYQATKKDVVVFTGQGKLVKVAVQYRVSNPRNRRVPIWKYKDCVLNLR